MTREPGEIRRILALAWPIMLTSLNWTLMHMIDVAVVGHHSTAELGALAAGRSITFITIVAGLAWLSGTLVFTARADGAGDRAATGDILRGGMAFGFALGLAMAISLIAFAPAMLRMIGVARTLVEPGAAVVRVIALAYPASLAACAITYFLEGGSHPRRVMVVHLGIILPVNAILAWGLVGGRFGGSPMGAVGAGLATAAASWIGAAAMLAATWILPDARARHVRDLGFAAWKRAAAEARRIAAFGVMPAFASSLEMAGFSLLIAFSTQLGATSAAAFQAAFSLHNFVFAFAMGFGSAAGVRVGNAQGSGEPHTIWPRTRTAAGLAFGVIGAMAILFILTARLIVAPFSNDPDVLALSATLVVILSMFVVFDGVQYVFTNALRALDDQVVAGVNSIVGFFVVTGGLGWLFMRGGYGAPGLVYAGGAGMITCAGLQYFRLRQLLGRRSLDASGRLRRSA